MGEAKRKKAEPQVIAPPKFQERLVTLRDHETGGLVACLLTITGAVYKLRRGERVRDREIIELVQHAARRESLSSDLIQLL